MRHRAFLACAIATLGAGCSLPAGGAGRPADGVFVHVTKGPESPHEVLMALSMANLMRESGRDVLVYFDIRGIQIVLADAPDLAYAHFAPSGAQIQKLVDAGAIVCACPGCLKAAGKTAADLKPGVRVADKDAFFDFTRGRILAIDY